jgi:hypothetical protein
MLMRNWIWMLAVLTALSFSTALFAQESKPEKAPEGEEKEAEGEEKEEDALAHYKAMFKDIDTVIGKTTVTEEGIKGYLDHHETFRDAMKKDKKFEELKEKNLKEAFDHAVKSEIATAWAKEKGVELDSWLRQTLRVMVLTFRAQIEESVAAQKEALAAQRKQVEELKSELSDEEYKEYIKALDEGDQALKDWGAMSDGLAKPTDAEDKVLKANAEKIANAMDRSDEGEGEEDDKGDDEMG